MGKFSENVNAVAVKLSAIETANANFNPDIVATLEEVAALDLQEVTDDFGKGTFLGNRKIDIDFAANKAGVASSSDPLSVWNSNSGTVYYSHAVATFTDGVSITVNFVNDDSQPINISTTADLVVQLLKHTAFTTKLTNTSITNEIGGYVGAIARISDIVGTSSNLERMQVINATGSTPVETNPIYYWAKTTSALQTLAMRAGDIIEIGNNINNIVTLSQRIEELLALQSEIAKLVAVYNDLANVVAAGTNIANINTVAPAVAQLQTLATNIAQLQAIYADLTAINASSANATTATTKAAEAIASANSASASAALAAQKAAQILAITATAVTGAAGTPASAVYNPADGKFTFIIPQGIKGDKGDAFQVSAQGLYAARSGYDAQPINFSFFASDTGLLYFKNSATSGDWSAGIPFGKGDKGDAGDDGRGVTSIVRTSGDGSAGSTDTYTITYSDASTSTFNVVNGTASFAGLTGKPTTIAGYGITDGYTKGEMDTALGTKQATLVSGTNIATINNQNLLLGGNINVITNCAAPTLSSSIATLTEATTAEINITNYEAGLTYRLVSSNAAVATATQSGGVITISGQAVSANSTCTIDVYAKAAGFAESLAATINVTVNDVPMVGDTEVMISIAAAQNLSSTPTLEFVSAIWEQELADLDAKQYKNMIMGLPDVFVSASPLTVNCAVAVGDKVEVVGGSGNHQTITATAVSSTTNNLANGTLIMTNSTGTQTLSSSYSGDIYCEFELLATTSSYHSTIGVGTVSPCPFAAASGVNWRSDGARFNQSNSTITGFSRQWAVGDCITLRVSTSNGAVTGYLNGASLGLVGTLSAAAVYFGINMDLSGESIRINTTPTYPISGSTFISPLKTQITAPTPSITPTKAYFLPKSETNAGVGLTGSITAFNTAISNITYTNSNYTITAASNNISVSLDISKNSGKHYAEFKADVLNGSPILGITTINNGNPIADATSLGYRSNGEVYKNGSLIGTYATWTANDKVGVSWDAAGTAKVFKNDTEIYSTTFTASTAFYATARLNVSGDRMTFCPIPTCMPSTYTSWYDKTLASANGYILDTIESVAYTNVPKQGAANILLSSDATNCTVAGDRRSSTVYVEDNNSATGFTGVAVAAGATLNPHNITVSASSEFSAGYEAWRAFDNTTSGTSSTNVCWANSASAFPCWLKVDNGAGVVANSYRITSPTDRTTQDLPNNWTFEGSNDNSNWTVLDTRTGAASTISSSSGGTVYTFTNITAYRYYRLNISSVNSGVVVLIITFNIMYNGVDLAPVLTGYTGSTNSTTFAHGLTSFTGAAQTVQTAFASSDMESGIEVTYATQTPASSFRAMQKRLTAPIVNNIRYAMTKLWKVG
jgi:hypothetical protein